MKRALAHVRANTVAYAALFVALGGTGYAASQAGSDKTLSARFGSSVAFGHASEFGPFNPGTGGGNGVPMTGSVDFDFQTDTEGGALQLLAPVALRFRDLRVKTFAGPLERPVRLTVTRVGGLDGIPLLRCVIPAGKTGCRKRGPSKVLRAGQRGFLLLEAPIANATLAERLYVYSLRIVPG